MMALRRITLDPAEYGGMMDGEADHGANRAETSGRRSGSSRVRRVAIRMETAWSREASRGLGAALHDPFYQIIGRCCNQTWRDRTKQEEQDVGT
jgi:hypothetical protein